MPADDPNGRAKTMKTIAKLVTWISIPAALAFGMTMYRGQLMDAACYNQNPNEAGKAWVRCAPTDNTTAFAIHTNGKVRVLDPAGNDKAEYAYKQGVLKRDKNGDMPVVIAGWRTGNRIKVESIRARGSDTATY